jgi:hypothetical protein
MEREFVKAPTAEEFINDIRNVTYSEEEKLIIFARLHVESALKAASEKGEAFVRTNGEWTSSKVTAGVNKESILNSYPLENIK